MYLVWVCYVFLGLDLSVKYSGQLMSLGCLQNLDSLNKTFWVVYTLLIRHLSFLKVFLSWELFYLSFFYLCVVMAQLLGRAMVEKEHSNLSPIFIYLVLFCFLGFVYVCLHF